MDTVIRVLIALAIGVVIWRLGLWGVRLLSMPGPTEPDPDDVVEVERTFVCAVCGMQLTVTYAQDADVEAPRHCREEMLPV